MKKVRKSASIGNRSLDELTGLMQTADPIRTGVGQHVEANLRRR